MSAEKKEFQRLLFRTAFCVMACDGEIHQDEIEEMKKMDKSTSYFQGVDFTYELEILIDSLKTRGKQLIEEVANEIKNHKLTTIQELLLLEVVLRMIHADGFLHNNEIKLFHLFRSRLNLFDVIIQERFGYIDFVFDKSYADDIIISENLISTIELPEIQDIVKFNISDLRNK